jgi:DNA-directed RNA polymerase specialized sigma24 family protein
MLDDVVLKNLALRAKAGDWDAFARLKTETQPSVRFWINERLPAQNDALHAEEDFFDNLRTKLRSYIPSKAKFTTWLYTCVSNHCSGHQRIIAARGLVSSDGVGASAELGAQALTQFRRAERIERFSHSTPSQGAEYEIPDYRTGATDYLLGLLDTRWPGNGALLRQDWQADRTRSDIASVLGISGEALRKRIFDANKRLEAIKREHIEAIAGITLQYPVFRHSPRPVCSYIIDMSDWAAVNFRFALNLYGLTIDSRMAPETVAGATALVKRIGATWDEALRLIRLTFAVDHGHEIVPVMMNAARGLEIPQEVICDKEIRLAESAYPTIVNNEIVEVCRLAQREFER